MPGNDRGELQARIIGELRVDVLGGICPFSVFVGHPKTRLVALLVNPFHSLAAFTHNHYAVDR